MCSLDTYKIDLKGLDEGENRLSFSLDNDYFKAIDATEVNGGDVHVDLLIQRRDNVFTLDFHTEGTVVVPCDVCLDDMEQPIEADDRLVAQFGEEDSDDGDEVVTVAEDEGILDISWHIYEFIALAIPVKHVHAPGKCNAAMIKALEEHSATRSSGEDDAEEMDPRWSELKKLKTIIKD